MGIDTRCRHVLPLTIQSSRQRLARHLTVHPHILRIVDYRHNVLHRVTPAARCGVLRAELTGSAVSVLRCSI